MRIVGGLSLGQQASDNPLIAGVAQSVEQRTRNAKVAGSTPVSGTNDQGPQMRAFCFLGQAVSSCRMQIAALTQVRG